MINYTFFSLLEKEAAFAVTKPITDDNGDKIDTVICYVTLTATCLRKKPEIPKEEKESNEDSKETSGTNDKPVEVKKEIKVEQLDEKDLLPKEKCLAALAELRHARWFGAMASILPSCVEVLPYINFHLLFVKRFNII